MKIYFNSLGCDKTFCDSEHILGSIASNRASLTHSVEDADLILVNTCCFIGDALEESINSIIEIGLLKEPNSVLVVFGCMAKRFYEETKKDLPEIDYIIPETEWDIISNRLSEIIAKHFPCDLPLENSAKRLITGISISNYLKIAEGCNKHCTYCVIPGIRGRYKSLPFEELIEEAKHLARNGTVEINIVAQESCEYGVDLYGKKRLHELLSEISKIEEISWIRLMYAYPEEIYPELIEEMAKNPKILHYIDMPIQHISDKILKLMGRKTSKAEILGIISNLRERIPDIAIRTTVITGFSGEGEEEHKELLSFIKEGHITRLGAFPYSREEGTPAYDLKNQVDEKTKSQRYKEIMTTQSLISVKENERFVGKVLSVLVEGRLPEDNVWQGRTYRDAPEIDGQIYFKYEGKIMSGDIVKIKVTESNDYDLMGEFYESAE